MKIMIIGGGGREHTLGWALAKGYEGIDFYFLPGNGGTITLGQNVSGLDDHSSIVDFALKNEIDLTVVGPEKPLVDGLVDKFQQKNLKIFGPVKKAARLEGSKIFAKELMAEAGVPTASFEVFDDFNAAKKHIEKIKENFVVKADGLAGGKGALVCDNIEDGYRALETLMKEKKFGSAGESVVIEDKLRGQEVSILALISEDKILPLIPSQDHKQLYEGDNGPNTGGMGAYAPVPFVSSRDISWIKEKIFRPTISELARSGIEYNGVLYAGLMLTKSGPQVLEFNVRFGDPETQAILPLLEGDFIELLMKTLDGNLPDRINFKNESAVAVVLASGGYPGDYEKGYEIVIRNNSCLLFHAGTRINERILYTDGGRVLSVVGTDRKLENAKKKAYKCIEKINFTNKYFRKDIAAKGIKYNKTGRL